MEFETLTSRVIVGRIFHGQEKGEGTDCNRSVMADGITIS